MAAAPAALSGSGAAGSVSMGWSAAITTSGRSISDEREGSWNRSRQVGFSSEYAGLQNRHGSQLRVSSYRPDAGQLRTQSSPDPGSVREAFCLFAELGLNALQGARPDCGTGSGKENGEGNGLAEGSFLRPHKLDRLDGFGRIEMRP